MIVILSAEIKGRRNRMFSRQIIILVLSLAMSGCIGDSSNKKSDNSILLGTITSSDMNYINADDTFDSLFVEVTSDSESNYIQQIILSIYDVDLPEDLNARASTEATWALVVRTEAFPVGTYRAEDIEVKLFSNYTRSNTYTSTEYPSFNEQDVADITYVAISGWVSFDSINDGAYEVQFQQQTDAELGLTSGPVVTVSGSIVNVEFLESTLQ